MIQKVLEDIEISPGAADHFNLLRDILHHQHSPHVGLPDPQPRIEAPSNNEWKLSLSQENSRIDE